MCTCAILMYYRAEVDTQEAGLKFGLMLETYLRGSVNHIPELQKQLDAIGKMRSISELLHSRALRDKVIHRTCPGRGDVLLSEVMISLYITCI